MCVCVCEKEKERERKGPMRKLPESGIEESGTSSAYVRERVCVGVRVCVCVREREIVGERGGPEKKEVAA